MKNSQNPGDMRAQLPAKTEKLDVMSAKHGRFLRSRFGGSVCVCVFALAAATSSTRVLLRARLPLPPPEKGDAAAS